MRALQPTYHIDKTLRKAKVFHLLSHSGHFREARAWRLTAEGRWPHPVEAWKLSKVHFPKTHSEALGPFTKAH